MKLTMINCGAMTATLNCPLEEGSCKGLSVERGALIGVHNRIDPITSRPRFGYSPSDAPTTGQVTDIHVRKPPEQLAGAARKGATFGIPSSLHCLARRLLSHARLGC
ncbi:hypothetical protein [Bradyrhizobium sp. USDA 4506]